MLHTMCGMYSGQSGVVQWTLAYLALLGLTWPCWDLGMFG